MPTSPSSFAISGTPPGIYEYAYDIWINGIATSGSTGVHSRGELASRFTGAWDSAGFDVCLFAWRGRGWQPSRVPGEPAPDDAAGLRAANARLRAVIEAQHAEIEVLRAAQEASQDVIQRLELRLAEVERRLAMDSSNSGTPAPKEGIAAGERRKARQRSERERSRDRKHGGQPGHRGWVVREWAGLDVGGGIDGRGSDRA